MKKAIIFRSKLDLSDSQVKVWVVVYKFEDGQLRLLALMPSLEPGRVNDPYVVTGGVIPPESNRDAALREVREEIGVDGISIRDLNKTWVYVDKFSGRKFIEHCFAVEVPNHQLNLNEEHSDFIWMSPAEFNKKIWWDGDRAELAKLIKSI